MNLSWLIADAPPDADAPNHGVDPAMLVALTVGSLAFWCAVGTVILASCAA